MLRIIDMKSKPRLMRKVAELYAEIFKEKPWSESFKSEEVMMLMGKQFNGPRLAITLVAVKYRLKRRRVVGFTWMYEIFKSDLHKGTRFSPELGFLFEGQKRVFYLQEVGVRKSCRKKGIGEKLIRKLLKKGKKIGASFVVLSTNTKATAAKTMFSKVGFRDSGIVRQPEKLGRTYWILEL